MTAQLGSPRRTPSVVLYKFNLPGGLITLAYLLTAIGLTTVVGALDTYTRVGSFSRVGTVWLQSGFEYVITGCLEHSALSGGDGVRHLHLLFEALAKLVVSRISNFVFRISYREFRMSLLGFRNRTLVLTWTLFTQIYAHFVTLFSTTFGVAVRCKTIGHSIRWETLGTIGQWFLTL